MSSKASLRPKANVISQAILAAKAESFTGVSISSYKSAFKRFKLVENVLARRGHYCAIVRSSPPGGWVYAVSINFDVVRSYKTRESAKRYLARYYLKLIEDEKKETPAT